MLEGKFQSILFLLHSITPLKYACSRVNFSQFGKKVLIYRGVFNSLSYTSASLIISRFAFIILRMVQIFSQATWQWKPVRISRTEFWAETKQKLPQNVLTVTFFNELNMLRRDYRHYVINTNYSTYQHGLILDFGVDWSIDHNRWSHQKVKYYLILNTHIPCNNNKGNL